MGIDAELFRNTLAKWASGVTVVTTTHDGRPHGLTVSSFSSVSLDASLILVCISHRAASLPVLMAAGHFAVNILSSSQQEVARRFAGMIPDIVDRFEGVEYSTLETGSPLLDGALAWIDCRTAQTVVAGDHTIFVGEIVAASVFDEVPLVYTNRRWGSFVPLT
ncbi:MAG: flavin reductase family protein [Chloroflexi bacterium]|nr:flavin reductase family protein [Chloroflexota bacterium]